MASYDDAVQELYRASLADFVTQRKRGVDALRAAGDKAAAKRLAERRRPTLSAWAVNQLYWHARAAFHALVSAAGRMRSGDLGAAGEHRQAMTTLRKRAAALLAEAGHAASESTLRRVTTTLAALAAAGGFDPDLPGTLAEDRDPPGFEAMAAATVTRPAPLRVEKRAAEAGRGDDAAARRQRMREEAAQRAAEEAEQRRREAAEKRRAAERHRLETRLRTVRVDLERREARVDMLRKDLRGAEHAVEQARKAIADLERSLAAVRDDD